MSEPLVALNDATGSQVDPMWQRRDKWNAFYAGTFAPHLGDGQTGSFEELPWRSFAPASQLANYITEGCLPAGQRVLELGCGNGESLILLAKHSGFACGVDIAPASVNATNCALKEAGLHDAARAFCVDVLELPDAGPLLQDGGGWEFDFVFDCQCFHCLRMIPELKAERLAEIYAGLLRPGGKLLLLTGSMDEPTQRGPERLTQDEVLGAFKGRLTCEKLVATHFDWTPTYRKQGFPEPPLGWLSVWAKSPEG